MLIIGYFNSIYYCFSLDIRRIITFYTNNHEKVIPIHKVRFFSLQYKILIFSLILILIPLLTVGIISYIKSSEIITKKVSASNLNTVRQIGSNIEFVIQDVHDSSLYLLQNNEIRNFMSSSSDKVPDDAQKNRIYQSLMYLLASKKYVHSIYIQGFNGVTIDTRSAFNQIDDATIKKASELKGRYIWTTGELTNYDYTKTNVFSLIRVMNDVNNITHSFAVLKINISENAITNIYKNELINEYSQFLIVNSQDKIISHFSKNGQEVPALGEVINDSIRKNKDGYYQLKIGGQSYLVTFYNIDSVNWKLINLVPLKELLKENIVIQEVMLYVIIGSFIVCAIFALLFSVKILGPLKHFRVLMKELENENFDVSFDVKGNDEIAMLGKSFNKMSSRLKELMNQIYFVRIKQREAELAALQAQINPHFLYNTLDTIYWLSRIENAFETSKLVEALSKLFRLSLNSGNEFTTVRDEVSNLQNYIIIQQKRYEDMISFTIDVSEDVKNCKVVKLILQPMVENAIYHGLEKKGEKGTITVSIYRRNSILVYEINDDGNGSDEVEVSQLLQKVGKDNRGFGIKNVNDRIKLYYGNDYGLEFHSSPGIGTKVIITQPYVKGDANNDRSNDR